MTIKTISGGRNNKEQWWNLNNATTLLYTSDTMLRINNQNASLVVLKATLKRNDIPAFIDGYLSELNNNNKMKYEVTINGTLPTIITNSECEDYINLACECTEAIILDTSLAYQSVDVSYVDDGDLDITIRKIITRTEPPTVGEMVEVELQIIDEELMHALIVIPFTRQIHLKNLKITDVKPVTED